jgi:hypothetical protein
VVETLGNAVLIGAIDSTRNSIKEGNKLSSRSCSPASSRPW